MPDHFDWDRLTTEERTAILDDIDAIVRIGRLRWRALAIVVAGMLSGQLFDAIAPCPPYRAVLIAGTGVILACLLALDRYDRAAGARLARSGISATQRVALCRRRRLRRPGAALGRSDDPSA